MTRDGAYHRHVEIALLIIAVVGTLAAIAAAVFSYPPWRERLLAPRLELRVRNTAGYQLSGPVVKEANLQLEAHNTGEGEAQNWRVELRTTGPGSGTLGFPNPRALGPGEEQYQLPGRVEVVEWRAVDATDVIPPGDKSRGLGPVRVGLPSAADFVCDCTITARRMKPRTDTITVTHAAPPEARITSR